MTDATTMGLRRPKAAAIRLIWLPILLAGAAWLVLRAAELTSPLWQLWLLALVFVTAVTVTVPLSSPYLEPDDMLPVHAQEFGSRSFGSVSRWESRLAGHHDLEDFHRMVQERLVLLAAERLRLRHGIELDGDGPRARRLLGDELYRFCVQPVSRVPGHAVLERLVTGIERI